MKKIIEHLHAEWYKYLLEILVITIGILGAFALNNWNENRNAKIERGSIIQNLNTEFRKNQTEMDRIKTLTEAQYRAGMTLMSIMGSDQANIEKVNPDSLLYNFIEGNRYISTQYTLQDLSSSGRIQLIANDQLVELIYEWQAAYDQMMEYFNGVDDKVEDDLVPFLTEHYAIKDIDRYGLLEWKTPSKLKHDKLKVFHNISFENQVDDLLFRVLSYQWSLEKVEEVQEKIINLTDHL